MRKRKQFILSLLLVLGSLHLNGFAETVLFFDDFTDTSVWPVATGATTLKTAETSYGTVKYLNLSVYSTTTKAHSSVSKTGYLDFRSGSTTITTTNSYIELPPCTFINGGIVQVTYGSGSTSKKMRLQEWTGTSWDNGTYDEVSTDKSSTWYTQQWAVSGFGAKTFRLVLTSSASIYLTDIKVTTNKPEITAASTDTLDFGTRKINSESQVLPVMVGATNLTSDIAVEATSPFKIALASDGSYYSSINLSSTGGTIYVKYEPTLIASDKGSLTLSAYNADSRIIGLKGRGAAYSSAKKITSFSLLDCDGVIDETAKTINIELPYSTDMTKSYTPVIAISPSAQLLTTGAITFTVGSTQSFVVKAEDGTTATYQLTVTKGAKSKDFSILEFVIGGKKAIILGKSITVNLGQHFDITALKPILKIQNNATLSSVDTQSKNFTTPQTYTVTAEDGVTTRTYTVTVTLVPDVFQGLFPYVSDMNSTYDDPIWITGGGETGLAPYQPDFVDDGNCKSTPGVYRLSQVGDPGETITLRVAQCGIFTVGISADGDRSVELSNNKNSVKDTIVMSKNVCGYGSIAVNSSQETLLYIKSLKATGTSNVFQINITGFTVPVQEKMIDETKVYAQDKFLIVDAVSGSNYSIYTINGILLKQGKTDIMPSAIELQSGIYLVLVKNRTYKVLVQ